MISTSPYLANNQIRIFFNRKLRQSTMDSAKPWFLYMIECEDNSIYTGVAVDVAARYALHLSGKGARYTRSHPPRRLMAVIEYPDQSSALKAEYEIKQYSPAQKRIFISTITR